MTLNELISMMKRIIQEDRKDPTPYRPLVAIGHTKDLTDPQAVDAFLSFLGESGIAVSTFEDIYPRLLCELNGLRSSRVAPNMRLTTKSE